MFPDLNDVKATLTSRRRDSSPGCSVTEPVWSGETYASVKKSFSSSSGVIDVSSGSEMQLRIADATIA